MPIFSARSRANLATCHPDLQRLFQEVIQEVDVAIICGHRNRADQDRAVREGTSQLQWPNSKHNATPSLAVDCIPCSPVDWHDIDRFIEVAAIIKLTATKLGIKVTWGGDWKWKDYPHWELVAATGNMAAPETDK